MARAALAHVVELTPNELDGFRAVFDCDPTVDLSEFIEMCKAEILSVYDPDSAVLDDSSITIERRGNEIVVRGTVWPIMEVA